MNDSSINDMGKIRRRAQAMDEVMEGKDDYERLVRKRPLTGAGVDVLRTIGDNAQKGLDEQEQVLRAIESTA